VFDATNLTAQFEWELKWTADLPDGNAPADAVSIFTALQEQLAAAFAAASHSLAYSSGDRKRTVCPSA
jgi:hypothetical protein